MNPILVTLILFSASILTLYGAGAFIRWRDRRVVRRRLARFIRGLGV